MELKDQLMQQIDRERLPQHIAIIMDGNGRWAKERGKARLFGHQSAIQSVREVSEGCAELGVGYLTLYAFSTENWNRPLAEVSGLMSLLATTITKEVVTMNKNSIKLNAIGDLKSLPKANYDQLMQAIEDTSHNTRMTLTLALSYSGRWDLKQASQRMANWLPRLSMTLRFRPTFRRRAFLIPNCSSAPAVKSVSATSCCGNWPILNSILPKNIGPTSARPTSMRRF